MMDTSQFCCPNEECSDYGKRGMGAIIVFYTILPGLSIRKST